MKVAGVAAVVNVVIVLLPVIKMFPAVLVNVSIVLFPDMVRSPAPPFERVQLNVAPPPTKVFAEAPDMIIEPEPVPAVVVNPVGPVTLNAVVEVVRSLIVPPLKVIFFVAVPETTKELPFTVSVLPFRSRVPAATVQVLTVANVKASASRQFPPTPLNLINWPKTMPLHVMIRTVAEVD